MPAKDYLGRQWTSGRDVMSQQLDDLFDLGDPEDNYELADYGDKSMLPDYESKSSPTKPLPVVGSASTRAQRLGKVDFKSALAQALNSKKDHG